MNRYDWKRGGWWVLLFFCWILFTSCTHKIYVPVEHTYTQSVVVRDTVVKVSVEVIRDSVILADTMSFLENKYASSWAQWSNGYLHHALSTKSDSFPVKISYIEKEVRVEIPAPYPVEVIKKVEKELSRWQHIRLLLGEVFFWLILVVLLGYILRIKFR